MGFAVGFEAALSTGLQLTYFQPCIFIVALCHACRLNTICTDVSKWGSRLPSDRPGSARVVGCPLGADVGQQDFGWSVRPPEACRRTRGARIGPGWGAQIRGGNANRDQNRAGVVESGETLIGKRSDHTLCCLVH